MHRLSVFSSSKYVCALSGTRRWHPDLFKFSNPETQISNFCRLWSSIRMFNTGSGDDCYASESLRPLKERAVCQKLKFRLRFKTKHIMPGFTWGMFTFLFFSHHHHISNKACDLKCFAVCSSVA